MRRPTPDSPNAEPAPEPPPASTPGDATGPERIAAGLWNIPVPIPDNPLGYTLVYLLETDRGPVLIDAGWQDPGSWEALTRGIRAAGSDVSQVYGVVCTHFHNDHAGLAGRVRNASGAWIAMHPDDAAIVRAFHGARDTAASELWTREVEFFRRAGADEASVRALDEIPRGSMEPPAIPDRELRHGDRVDVPGRVLGVVHTPGHTPGHVCLRLEDAGGGELLFSGDHVLPRITPHIALHPYDGPDSDPLGDFLTSLERVADIPARHVLPAHKHRFSGLAERTAAIAGHHRHRMAELEDAVVSQPRTLWEITRQISWNRPWETMSPFLRRMALAEAAAHLRRLERIGRVAGTRDEIPIRFFATRQ